MRGWLPPGVFELSYLATSVLGALMFMTERGQKLFVRHVEGVSPPVLQAIGSVDYLLLLLLPVVLTPLAAWAGLHTFRRVALKASGRLRRTTIAPWATIALLLLAVAYCGFKVAHVELLPLDDKTDYRNPSLLASGSTPI